MRITKRIGVPDVEVDIDITGEEAVQAIIGETEGWTPRQLMLRAVNNVAGIFRALPDSVVEEFTPEQRRLVAELFEEQAKRFRQSPLDTKEPLPPPPQNKLVRRGG